MDALTFLERGDTPQPVYAVHGEEDFLKRQVFRALRDRVLGDSGDFGLSTLAGDRATFADVNDELHTLPLLGGRRLVVVENADPFVTNHRAALEKYVAEPARNAVLVLDVKTWPANTRLARHLGSEGAIVCKALAPAQLPAWCVAWATSQHDKQLTQPAARALVELVGAEMGQLEQELAKLAAYVGDGRRIDERDVDQLVGSSRAENTWKIFDAVAEGRAGQGLAILDRVLDQGEEPLAILGAFSWQLRKLAQAARLSQQGRPLGVALEEAGILPFRRRNAEQLLRHLGWRRINRLYDWLLETDLGLKGSCALPERTQLERLLVRLARPNR